MVPRRSRSSLRTRALGLVTALAIGIAAPGARADVSAEDGAIAEALFREGRALLEDGKIDAACLKLEGSQKLDPKVGTLLNVAACHELQGRTASAWGEFLEAARLARVANVRDPKVLADVATKRAEALAPKLQRLAVERPETLPQDLELSLDGRVIPRGAWETPIPVDPGERVVTARAPGKLPWTTRVLIEKAPLTTVAVPTLEPLAPVVTPVTPPRTEEEPPSPTTSAPFLIGAGAFVVGSGVGAYFGLRAISEKKERDRECDALGCSEVGLAKQRDAHTSATVSTVAFAVGAAGGIFALYWALSPQTNRNARGVSATAACDGQGACALVTRGSF